MPNKDKFSEDNQYNIQIYGRNVQVTEAMKQHALGKLSKIDRLNNHIIDIHVFMDIQRVDHSVTIVATLSHVKIKAHAVSSDMYVSIDQAVDKLQKQMLRWKEKIQAHHSKKLSSVDMKVNVIQRPYNELEEINQEIESASIKKMAKELTPGHVIGEKTIPLKDLSEDEAVMKMELSGDHFLLYRSEEDRKIKVMYRRDDGNYGIIHAE